MPHFIRHLAERYRSIICASDDHAQSGSQLEPRLPSLELAEAFLDKGRVIEVDSAHPPQIAIIGPTQCGKSSIVNLLAGAQIAAVSPLAGFTRHPHGFRLNDSNQDHEWIADYFRGFERFVDSDPPDDRFDCYTLTRSATSTANALPPVTLWDTPDFDSVQSEEYRRGLLRTIALADIVIVVLSKDKYGDQTVWDMMNLVEPLAQSLVLCLNKIQPDNLSVITASLAEKWSSYRSDSMPRVISIPFRQGGVAESGPEQKRLHAQITSLVSKIQRKHHGAHARQLLKLHWENWVAPVREEIRWTEEWNALVEESVDDALRVYRQTYLDHPQHYETFQRALAELLTLLEIPGLAPVLVKTRQILTWPVRQILNIGRIGREPGDTMALTIETETLQQVFEHFVTRVSEQLLSRRDEDPAYWKKWQDISLVFNERKNIIKVEYYKALEQYQADFRPEIEAAANDLFQRLQEQPATLNSLRATRFTTDAAAVAVALKTGGIGVQDFILTPAVLTLTSFLTESALGGYMNRVASGLKKKQLQTVTQTVFKQHLHQPTGGLVQHLDPATRFGLSAGELEQAEAGMAEKRYGLRLF